MARNPPKDTESEERFLARWARRKRDAQDGDVRPEGTPGAVEPARATAPGPEQEPSAPAKTDADMPPLETIDETTDMADFFSPQVSEGLRRVALRKLFHLPKFNIIDDLDDYNESFRDFRALGDIITADMRHRMERAEEQARSYLDEPSGEAAEHRSVAQPDAHARDEEHQEEEEDGSESLGPAADSQEVAADVESGQEPGGRG